MYKPGFGAGHVGGVGDGSEKTVYLPSRSLENLNKTYWALMVLDLTLIK